MSQKVNKFENYDSCVEIELVNKNNSEDIWVVQQIEHQGIIIKIEISQARKHDVIIYTIKKPDIYHRHKFVHNGENVCVRIYENGNKELLLKNGKWVRVCDFLGCCVSGTCGQTCALHNNGNTQLKKPKIIPKKDKCDMISSANALDIGSKIEEYIYNILQTFDIVKETKWIAGVNAPFDILYKLVGETEFRGIQIKKLVLSTYEDNYMIHKSSKIIDDLLYVCTNDKFTRFVIIYGKNAANGGLTFPFYSKHTKYEKNMYKDYDDFINNLKKELYNSTIVTTTIFKESLTKEQLMEYESIERFEKQCSKYKLKLERCSFSQCKYDIIVNNKRIQCKSSTIQCSNQIKFWLCKRNMENGLTPYDETDEIDFVMLESMLDQGNFYIIPKSRLVTYGYFTLGEIVGKKQIYITNKTLKLDKQHWTDEYYNAFHLLK